MFLLGPWLIVPQAIVVAGLVGGRLYDPPELHGHLERHLFLQGSTDLGGGCMFAGTIALYVVFGFTAAWYLSLKLNDAAQARRFGSNLSAALWILRFHLVAFLLGGISCWGYDARVAPNDFRNLFLWAGLVYGLSLVLVSVLHATRLPDSAKCALAPLFTLLWLVLGSDGNTARAGQLVQSGQNPQPIVRGARHAVMLSWHRVCDATFGDVHK